MKSVCADPPQIAGRRQRRADARRFAVPGGSAASMNPAD